MLAVTLHVALSVRALPALRNNPAYHAEKKTGSEGKTKQLQRGD